MKIRSLSLAILLPLLPVLLSACTLKPKTVYVQVPKQALPAEFKKPCKTSHQLMAKPKSNKQIAELIVRQNAELKNCEAKRAGLAKIYDQSKP